MTLFSCTFEFSGRSKPACGDFPALGVTLSLFCTGIPGIGMFLIFVHLLQY